MTGRLKDLIIIRGQSHYSEDVERTVQTSIGGRADCLSTVFSVPRTSSGKVQRGQCRQQFLDDSFKVIDRWQPTIQLNPTLFPEKKQLTRNVDVSGAQGRRIVRERIERVLLSWLCRQLGCDKNSINAQRPFAECGIDSLMAVEMSGQMEHWLDVRLSPIIAWSHFNTEKLAEYLTDQ